MYKPHITMPFSPHKDSGGRFASAAVFFTYSCFRLAVQLLLQPVLAVHIPGHDEGYHIVACGWATQEDLDTITDYTFKINEFLKDFFKKINVDLVDFKIEFGKTRDGKIILADEISPDTCRLWDSTTHEKLDKDRFRRDLGNVEGAYQEMMNRIFGDR